MASKVFEYVNAISFSKDRSLFENAEFEKEYVPFIVNRAFSYFEDSVLAANAMNERPFLSKQLQAIFLLNTLRSRKRFAKWLKNECHEDVASIAKYYGCSIKVAKSMQHLHTPEQLEKINKRLDTGGRK